MRCDKKSPQRRIKNDTPKPKKRETSETSLDFNLDNEKDSKLKRSMSSNIMSRWYRAPEVILD